MLNIAQLAQVKARDPYVYESLRQIVSAINALGRATGVDPSGSIAQPDRIGGISALAANGIFDIAITDNSAVHRGIYYFAESDVSPNFNAPRVWFMGSSRNLRVSLGNLTLYWRGYSQYIGSAPLGAGHVWLATHRSGGRRICWSDAAAFFRQRNRYRAAGRQRIRHRAHAGDERHNGIAAPELVAIGDLKLVCSGAL